MLLKQKRVREASLYALEESTGVARVKGKRLGNAGRGAPRAQRLATRLRLALLVPAMANLPAPAHVRLSMPISCPCPCV